MQRDSDTGSSVVEMTPSLVRRLRAGDAEAGMLLDSLYREALVRFCWGYLGRLEEAEDAVQDVCYKVLKTDRVPDVFRPWLYKIARNHCLNLLRGRDRRKDDGALAAPSQVEELLTGHLTRLVRDEEEARLAALVRRLPGAQQEVLRLRYVEGLSRGEISDVLEIPTSLVKSRLFEGLERLRNATADNTPS